MASTESSPGLTLSELFTAFTMLGGVVFGIAVSAIESVRSATVEWLLTYDLLITDNLAVTIPGTDGAGLDTPRLIVFGVALGILLIGFLMVCRWRGRRELRQSQDA